MMSTRTIDFIRPHQVPMLGWWLLIVGIASLSVSLWLDQRWAAERAEQQAAIQRRDEAAQRARQVALRPVPLTADELRLQRVRSQLDQPWLPVLRVIENATEAPVYLLAMSIDPASGAVRLDGEAPSFDHALAYVQLVDEEGLLGPAHLISHDPVNDPGAGRASVRFTVVTRWRLP